MCKRTQTPGRMPLFPRAIDGLVIFLHRQGNARALSFLSQVLSSRTRHSIICSDIKSWRRYDRGRTRRLDRFLGKWRRRVTARRKRKRRMRSVWFYVLLRTSFTVSRQPAKPASPPSGRGWLSPGYLDHTRVNGRTLEIPSFRRKRAWKGIANNTSSETLLSATADLLLPPNFTRWFILFRLSRVFH